MDRPDPHEPTMTLDAPRPTRDDPATRIVPTTRLDEPHRLEPAAPAAAGPPLRSTTLTVLGLVWAAVLMGAGAVGIHDGLAESGTIGDDPWVPRAIAYVDGIQPDEDVLIATGIGGLIGLALVVLALWPRRRRKFVLRSPAGVYVRQRHLERVLAGRMETVDGVLQCWVDARRRTVNVEARGVSGVDTGKLYGTVASLTRDDLDLLPRRPDLQILVRVAD